MTDALKRAERVETASSRVGKLPWVTLEGQGSPWNIEDAEGQPVAITQQRSSILPETKRDANTAYIVTACNESQALAADVRQLVAENERLRERCCRDDEGVTIHECPPKGQGFFPCCGLPPFERLGDRMTTNPAKVNCDRLAIREHVQQLTALWEACKPLCQHDPQVADLAISIGLLDPPRLEDPTVASERGGDGKESA